MELALAHETIARWQFGTTTVYHYLFVPLTISLAAMVAGLETAWVRTGKEKYFHATKFWGKLFLINIAMGVVTGLVQEFQFGMNWSRYSRFVGDVFGAPLAMEALIAFFFEATFIGLWIFGWDKLPKKLHLACMWMVAIGTLFSAYFILSANSFMQHPVGYHLDPVTGNAHLTNIWRILFQNTALVQFWHTVSAAFLTGPAFMIGIASYHLWRAKRGKDTDRKRISAMRTSLRLGLVLALVAGILTAESGDRLGKVMFVQQPMKMAAAEALWDTQGPAPFSIFAIGDINKGRNDVELQIPRILSFLAKDDFSSPVPGINERAKAQAEQFGGSPKSYIPNVFVEFWGFRLMITFGMTSFAIGLIGLYLTRKKLWLNPQYMTGDDEVPRLMLTKDREFNPLLTKWGWWLGILTLAFPLIGNGFGWIFTEMGRQPWVVYHLMKTSDAVTPGSIGYQIGSLATYTVLYAILAVIEVKLMIKYAKAGPDTHERPPTKEPSLRGPGEPDQPLAFAY